jgi:hypothetical protein
MIDGQGKRIKIRFANLNLVLQAQNKMFLEYFVPGEL